MEEPPDVRNIIKKLESGLPICRVCLDTSMEYIEFEGTLCIVNGQEVTYAEGFNEISSSASDLPARLPSDFCATCANDLLNAYLFLKRVENANFLLCKVKHFEDESIQFNDEKDEEYLSAVEPDNCTENLKVECFPDLLDNEFTKFIDHDSEDRSQSFAESSIKMENQEELMNEFQLSYQNEITLKDDQQQEDLEILPDSQQSSIFIDTDIESAEDISENNDTNNHDSVWICDECGETYETKEMLTEHRNSYKSKGGCRRTCVQCNRFFEKREQLDDHLLFHHCKMVTDSSENMVYRCTWCENNCRTEDEFIDHVNVHRGLSPHVCNMCSNAFHTNLNLQLHKLRVHTSLEIKRRKGNECEKCEHCQRIVRKSHMERHLETHSAVKEFSCPVCENKFASKFGLNAHSVTHRPREFTCHLCDKICLTDSTLRKHIKYMHINSRKKYQCEDCGLVFQYPSYLRDHQRKHNMKNRFQCPHCDRSYCRKPQLNMHMRYHNNDFRYKCDKCDKCYVNKSNLTEHVRSRHTKITYDCDECTQKFKSVTGLRKHRYTHTGYPYICPMCSVGQTSRSGMKAHLFRVHRNTITEEEFNEMFPIIIPKSGYRRPIVQ